MGGSGPVKPLTEFQKRLGRLLARNRSPDSYLAGGTGLHFLPTSTRYSNDLDFFHDSEERVARAFAEDSALMREEGLTVRIELTQPGYIRATVTDGVAATKVEWAHDSAWRFMPPLHLEEAGYILHPVDLAVTKVLVLAGRDEARDFLDVLYIEREILRLGALVWAAVGKDPASHRSHCWSSSSDEVATTQRISPASIWPPSRTCRN
ncbi:MAG: hypothetical protein Kow001_09770 [Acidobacteriota bacterium]